MLKEATTFYKGNIHLKYAQIIYDVLALQK
jgi:hypothetical protein